MYNSTQKHEFLNTIVNDNSYKAYQRVFGTIEDMEEKFGKDVCDMSVDEILVVLDLKTGVRITNTEQTMSLLRSYTNWCIQNGKTTSENNFDKITASEIDRSRSFRAKYVKSPEEFEEMVKVVYNEGYDYNPGTEKAKELSVRLVYEGLEDKEIVLLKKDDVDYEKKTIKSPLYDDVVYSVSDKILSLCEYCSEQEVVEFPSKQGVIRKERLCQNDYVLRQRIGTLRGNPEDRAINASAVSRWVKDFCNSYVESTGNYRKISVGKLRESRMLYNIHESGKGFEVYFNCKIRSDMKMRNPELSERNIQDKMRVLGNSFKLFEETFY